MAWYNSKAPSLPLPPKAYDQRQQDQFENALRLYFNRLDDALYALSANTGGKLLGFPHIAASDATDQYATGNNTATVVKWGTLESGSGWTLNAPGSATPDQTGIYKITYSLQFVNNDTASEHIATVWLEVDGVEIGRAHV